MINEKNARPGGNRERAVNGKAGSISKDYSTPDFSSCQIKIADFLHVGQENAISLRDLKTMTGFDGREIRKMIQHERLSGVPILADCRTGYYLPRTELEKQLCVKSMFHRASEIQKSAAAIFASEIVSVSDSRENRTTQQETIAGWFDG